MSIDLKDTEVCEACGCAGEIGFIIKEGDDVSEVMISATSQELLDAEFTKYLNLAQSVCKNVQHDILKSTEESTELTARFKFEVSAEKLIFELKTRSLRR